MSNRIINKTIITITIAITMFLSGCTDARIVSENISKASDMFEVDRRIVFYNGITSEYMLTINGKCSLEPNSRRVAVICKTGEDSYKKHYLGLSDNVTYFAEQLEPKSVNAYHYRVIFKPQTILPDIDFRGDIQ